MLGQLRDKKRLTEHVDRSDETKKPFSMNGEGLRL